MRITRLKLDEEVSEYLKNMAKQFGFDDPGFVEDMFSLLRLKGAGLPSDDRMIRLTKYIVSRNKSMSEIGVSLLIKKRKIMLESLLKLPYFHALAKMPDATAALERLIVNFKKLYYKVRTAQCLSCDLINKCKFGKQYSNSVKLITRVIDPDFEKKVHDDCPVRPEIAGLNQMVMAVNAMRQVASGAPDANIAKHKDTDKPSPDIADTEAVEEAQEDLDEELEEKPVAELEDEDQLDTEDALEDNVIIGPSENSSSGESVEYQGDHNANGLCNITEKLIRDLSVSQLMVFELGTKFSKELQKAVKGKFAPVQELSQSKDTAMIEKVSDIGNIVASQHGLPEEVFNARLEKRGLIKNVNLKRTTKQKKLYLLIDNSASMSKFLEGNSPFAIFTRGALAAMFSLSLIRNLKEERGKVFVRFFTGQVGDLHSAETSSEFDDLLDYVSTASYISGSTHIPGVLITAHTDMEEANVAIGDVEVLLITDTEDYFTAGDVRSLIGEMEVNVLDVSGGGQNATTSRELKKLANKYYKADHTAAAIKDIVKIV